MTRPAPLAVLRTLAMAIAAALALTACAAPQMTTGSIDHAALSPDQRAVSLNQLAERYQHNPRDRGIAIAYAVALRGAAQPAQAVSVLEATMAYGPPDAALQVAYAKALSEVGRFDQALNVIDAAIVPETPNWNALSVKGAILDQMNRPAEARQAYTQALTIAPGEASLYANLGLSFALTHELDDAEANLRRAVRLPGATTQIRQNLALVVGLAGRFEEARQLYAAELPPDQVEANLAYIRSMMTEQDRWGQIAAQ